MANTQSQATKPAPALHLYSSTERGEEILAPIWGHNDIKTTLRYLHVTNKDLVNILSPLEDIENLIKK
jgi:hypothetical protein